MSKPTTEPTHTPTPKRTRKPKPKTDFALADEATRALADIDAKITKAEMKLTEQTKERLKLIASWTPAVKKLLGFEGSKEASD